MFGYVIGTGTRILKVSYVGVVFGVGVFWYIQYHTLP